MAGSVAAPTGRHRDGFGQVLDRHFGAQLVEAQPSCEVRHQRARRVEQEAAAALLRRRHDDEIEQDLALRRQQRAEAGLPGTEFLHVGGDQPLEEARRIVAADVDDPSIGQMGGRHRHISAACLGGLADISRPSSPLKSGICDARDLRPPAQGRHGRQPGRRRPSATLACGPEPSRPSAISRLRAPARSSIAPASPSCRASSTRRCISASPGSTTRRISKPARAPPSWAASRPCSRCPTPSRRPPRRAPSPTRSARASGRMHCDFAFWVGGTHENVDDIAGPRAPAGRRRHQGVHGLVHRLAPRRGRQGRGRHPGQDASPRRLPFRGRAIAARAPLAACGRRSVLASGLAFRRGGADLHAAPGAHRPRAGRAHPCPARHDGGRDALPRRPQGRGDRRGDAASPHARCAGLLSRASAPTRR